VCEHGESPAFNWLKRRKINMSGDVVPSWPKNSWDSLLFHPLFWKPHFSSQKPLKNLSFSLHFWHEIWHFLTPDSENRTPDLTLFDPRNLRNLTLFGVTFCHFFTFRGHFLSLFQFLGHFFTFLRFGVTFHHFWGQKTHFLITRRLACHFVRV